MADQEQCPDEILICPESGDWIPADDGPECPHRCECEPVLYRRKSTPEKLRDQSGDTSGVDPSPDLPDEVVAARRSGVSRMSERLKLPCQVCGKSLTVRPDGLTRKHGHGNACPGVGYQLARWPVGQRLRHHSGSVWEVIDDDGHKTRPWSPDYRIRCVVGSAWGDSEQPGKEMTTHGEYMHRHGWTPTEGKEPDRG